MTFREHLRAWLEESCPLSMRTPMRGEADEVWGGRRATFPHPDAKLWLERMAARGYTAPTWPRAYGGAELSDEDAGILADELCRLGCRPPLRSIGLWMLGPVLLRFASEDQKREFLPPIVRGEIRWCQGYSEPGAGSDLASLSTRAVLDGDSYVVTGQKIWTSHADRADWMFCLVRTAPAKHAGIAFLLIDMASAGISVRPIPLISGASPFCQTFFDEVRVPARNRIGVDGQGWEIAKALLGEERRSMSNLRVARTEAEEPLESIARRYGVLEDPILRDRITQANLDALACKCAARRGELAPSLLKLVLTEQSKRRRELLVAIAGFQGLGWEGEGFTAGELQLTRDWLRSRANSIEGGTSEIQLNIIAKRILELPD